MTGQERVGLVAIAGRHGPLTLPRSRVAQRIDCLASQPSVSAAAALTDPTAIREAIAAYEQAGCDELMLFPYGASLGQVQLLAQAVR